MPELLFGLPMDYEVFLITAAAAIMRAVFGAIVPSDQVFIKIFGVGMVPAILVDATVIRMLLVLAVVHMSGRANWWLPRGLARELPEIQVSHG